MTPRVVVHNTISLDGSITGFEVDMGLHYRVAGAIGATVHLVGSGTARAGFEAFGRQPETVAHRSRPDEPAEDARPHWVFVDSKGELEGAIHAFRGTPYGRDPVVLLSERTPAAYRDWLAAREYAHHVVGRDRVDLASALALLRSDLDAETVLVDAGPGLVGALLEAGLVDEISLIVAPRVVGARRLGLFDRVASAPALEPIDQETREGNALLRLRVRR